VGRGGVPVLAAAENANVELLVLQAMDRILQQRKIHHRLVTPHILQ
jgi:hypothetical protein